MDHGELERFRVEKENLIVYINPQHDAFMALYSGTRTVAAKSLSIDYPLPCVIEHPLLLDRPLRQTKPTGFD